jgi:hypothetical protein
MRPAVTPLARRLPPLSLVALLATRVLGGEVAATETVARWYGRALDPAIAALFLEAPAELLRISEPDDVWAAVVDAEPTRHRTFRDDACLDEALAAFGDAADLSSERSSCRPGLTRSPRAAETPFSSCPRCGRCATASRGQRIDGAS